MRKKHFCNKLLIGLTAVLFCFACKSNTNEQLSMEYEKYVMPNGLQVVLHEDHSDPMISYAIMYHVGSSRETPGKTGFAHLFEHLLFGGSENVEPGKFDKIIENAGGSNNGFTSEDVTAYYETFPKNALEKILWLESDRMGFFINSVTPRSLAIQQNVVQNEKRQGEDNSPYGFTNWVISKNLYPAGHPYSWEVIGEMADLRSATLDDVKSYYEHFYGPNNATLVLTGDFDSDTVKALLTKYFGEIKSHGEVEKRSAMPVTLDKTIKLYHEDNFANAPELTMVWPVPESYTKDSYALDFLAKVLADGKKAPMYKVLVKEKNLTSSVDAYNSSSELAGQFVISVRANEGKSLKEVESAVEEAFARFEKEGITPNDIEKVKAQSEKSFYDGLDGVNGKALKLAFYNTFLGDPGFIGKDIQNIKAVTLDDVKRVYEKYIKGKPHVVTSFVPRGATGMMAENSVPAGVKEENINSASQVAIADTSKETITKTPSALDRTKEPAAGEEPEVNIPEVWEETLSNGIVVAGIRNRELPVVDINIEIEGGMLQDKVELPGVSNLVANMLPQGTKSKTPEELEEEIKMLGSSISVMGQKEEISINSSSLSRNFAKTVSLIKEIILEPRWDSTEFSITRNMTRNMILQSEAEPTMVANLTFGKLLYGSEHIFGYSPLGNKESIDKITLNDLKTYYQNNFSPSVTRIQVSGNVSKREVLAALKPLEKEWKAKDVKINNFKANAPLKEPKLYFVDIPGSRQSVIMVGCLTLSRTNPDYVYADFVNYRLGGAFTSILNQILREEKGFTYGAGSDFFEQKTLAPFRVATSVRSDATFETMKIIREQLDKYRYGIFQEAVDFSRNCMIRSNALRFETNASLVNMLRTMTKYGLKSDYVKKEENVIRQATQAQHRAIAEKYLDPDKMYYIVVGDAATQMAPLEKLGLGKPILLKR